MTDYVRLRWLTMADMDMARYGGGCWSGYEEVGQITSLNFMASAVSEWAGSGRKSAGAGPGPAPAPALFLPDPAHSETADGMKLMMTLYFDPPFHILTRIHPHIWPYPYLTYAI